MNDSIEKFETFEDAERALWCFKPDAEYYERVRELWKLANHLCPPQFPQGVFKYKTFEEANKQKEEWVLANALKRRKERKEK
ncbi:MAG: hypothetical protein GY940_09015 [bacterium]|nr:hypothetical protein [bacterium]